MSDSINQWGGSATKAEVAPQIVVRRPLFPGVIFLALGVSGLVIGIPGIVFQLLRGRDGSPAYGILLGLGAASCCSAWASPPAASTCTTGTTT